MSNNAYRVLRELRKQGLEITVTGHSFIRINTPYGVIEVPKDRVELLSPIAVNKDEMYGIFPVKDRIVIDVGGYIGDTALYFVTRGAQKVLVYEPVKFFYELMLHNIKLNNINDKIESFNKGIWYEYGSLEVKLRNASTGLELTQERKDDNAEKIEVEPLVNALLRARTVAGDIGKIAVKMDCMGCEYSLITLDCNSMQIADNYLVKIYGAAPPIIWKARKCGFKVTHIMKHIYLLTLEDPARQA